MVLINFYLVYRLNRDEGIIVMLQERIAGLENFIPVVVNVSEKKVLEVEEK